MMLLSNVLQIKFYLLLNKLVLQHIPRKQGDYAGLVIDGEVFVVTEEVEDMKDIRTDLLELRREFLIFERVDEN